MTVLPNKTELSAERCRRSYPLFVQQAWTHIEPAPFQDGFHVGAVGEVLAAVAAGEIRKLIISIPPRHGKSLMGSVMFAPWVWITDPTRRFLYASYRLGLAEGHSIRARRLIESPWYQERWGHLFRLSGDQNQAARFSNTLGGERIATSVGGHATGEGGDIVIIDDALKIDDALSAAARERAIFWFMTTVASRLNDPRTGAFVVIGQRVHEHDLTGALLAEGGWHHLCLPAEYDPSHPFLWPNDPRTKPGQPLWPNRFGTGELAELRRRMGSHAAAGQLQQLPAPAQGGIFDRADWSYYDTEGPLPDFERIIQSWDPAFTDTASADYTVGQVWGKAGARFYLLRQIRRRMTLPEMIETIATLHQQLAYDYPDCRSRAVLVEKSANGHAAIEALQDRVPGVIPISPVGSKEARAHAITPVLEARQIYLPGAPNHDHTNYDPAQTPQWVQEFVEEAATFPRGRHDDQVDAMTQAVSWLNKRKPRPRVRRVR